MSDKIVADISTFNKITNYEKFTKYLDGVIVRVGYSGYINGRIKMDAKFKRHMSYLVGKTTPLGFYFTSQAVVPKEAIEEAHYVANQIRSYTQEYPRLGVFIDLEGAPSGKVGRADNITKEMRTVIVKAFCDTIIKELGCKAGVYASKYWILRKLDMSKLSDYLVWIAQYNSECTYGGKYDMWQYTSKGLVDGTENNVDLSVCYYLEEPQPKYVYMLSMGDFATQDEAEKARADVPSLGNTHLRKAEIKNVEVID